jgi:hypothetical protein
MLAMDDIVCRSHVSGLDGPRSAGCVMGSGTALGPRRTANRWSCRGWRLREVFGGGLVIGPPLGDQSR